VRAVLSRAVLSGAVLSWAGMLVVTLLVVAIALVQGASAQGSLREPLNPRVTLKMGAVGALSDAGIFVALDRGFFRAEGLDVELVSFKNGPQIIPSLATGQTQVSGATVSPSLFNALVRGVDMKLVTDKGQVSKGFGWAALAVRSDLAGTIKDYKEPQGPQDRAADQERLAVHPAGKGAGDGRPDRG
jgi:NitT/TauT family transport system substrate-binding protein